MPQTKAEIVEKNVVEAPLYTPWDAARYLHVSLWGLFALSGRFRGWPEPEWFYFPFHRGIPHPFVFDDEYPLRVPANDRNRISFRRFADLFVRAAAFQALVDWLRLGDPQKARCEELSYAIWRGLEDSTGEMIPFDDSPIDERADGLVAAYAQRLEVGQKVLLRKWFTLRLERIVVKDGMPLRIYPFSRDPAEKSPRIVALDPRIRFGRPTLVESGVPTDSLFERYQAGDSIAELAEDYSLTPSEVEEAIRFEALPSASLFPFPGW